MTPGSRHTTTKSTQRLLLARRVNFLVTQMVACFTSWRSCSIQVSKLFFFLDLSTELQHNCFIRPTPHSSEITLKVLNFWKFSSCCSLKPLWSGMGEVVLVRTSPTIHPPSPPTVHQLSWLTSTLRVNIPLWKLVINTVNPQFKSWALINFMVHNHPSSNRERGEIETITLLNLLIWMGKLTPV